MNVQWVSCEERLPTLEDKEIVVYFANSGCYECVNAIDYFADITNGVDEYGIQHFTKWYLVQNVTHWLEGLEYPENKRET